MSVRIVRLGAPRAPGEGLRLGTVRRPPRGVKKDDFARRDYYDTWLPELAPSAELVKSFFDSPMSDARWPQFQRRYRREMDAPDRRHLLDMLARMSHQSDFSVGCYCENPERCHRSILRALLAERGADIAPAEDDNDKETPWPSGD
jgi:uncharacterized protein YeaO (DUF488 family)